MALWREALLAKHVLQGKTRGYKHHPQLARFRKTKHPRRAIDRYLSAVYEEALRRGYTFDRTKIPRSIKKVRMTVTGGQLGFEARHLASKLRKRDLPRYRLFRKTKKILPHPMFKVVKGGIAEWEIR